MRTITECPRTGFYRRSLEVANSAVEGFGGGAGGADPIAPVEKVVNLAWRRVEPLHRYNVLKTTAVGVITVWKWPAAFLEG
jgi:hypothetical protein